MNKKENPSRASDQGEKNKTNYNLGICLYNTIFSSILNVGFTSIEHIIKTTGFSRDQILELLKLVENRYPEKILIKQLSIEVFALSDQGDGS